MAYERLNLNKNDTWKAEHVKHIEDGIDAIENRITCMKKIALVEEQTIEGFGYKSDLGVYFRALTPSPCVLELNKEYIVKYDGTEYTCTSFVFDTGEYQMVAVGNKVLIGEQDTGEPFAIAYNAETDYLNIFVMTTDYSHDIAIYHETIVDKLPEITADDNGKVLQVVDGNWIAKKLEVKDSNKKVVLLEEAERSFVHFAYFDKYGYDLDASVFIPVSGETYNVMWDGTEYICTAIESNGGIGFGNGSVLGLTEDTGEPFLLIYTDEVYAIFSATDTDYYSHNIEIYQFVEGNKLPEVTTDDNGKVLQVVNGNWDLRMLELSGISDRVTLVEEQELPFTIENGVGTLGITDPNMVITIDEGETYSVKFDGTEYECVGVLLSTDIDGDPLNLYYIGNASLANMGEDTGEPFVIAYILESNSNLVIVSGEETTHIVGLDKLDSSTRLPKVTEEDNGKVLCVVDGKYRLTRLSSASSGNGSSASWDVLTNQYGETHTYVTINKTGHEESSVIYNIKTDGNIVVTTFFWSEGWLKSITMGEHLAEIIIDNNYPLFDKFYNIISTNHYLIGQFNYLSTGGFHFGLTCFCSSTSITFRIIARETKSVAGQLDDNGSPKQVGVLYTNNVF